MTRRSLLLGALVLGAALLAVPAQQPVSAQQAMAGAPLVEKLATFDNEKIIQALTTPVPMMAGAVSGMSDEDKRNVAVFLTKKSLPAEGSLPEVKAE